MASNQLQEKFEEANRVLSGKFSSREDMSINIEEEIELIEEQKLETKFEERNSGGGLSRNYSNREDTLTDAKEEIQLIEEQQLQAKIKEASKVLSGKFSKREDISINIEEKMGLIEQQQMETKFEEPNIGILRKRSNKEDILINVEEEMELEEDQQRRRVQESGAEDINTSSPTIEEKDDVIASRSQNIQVINVMKEILDDAKPSLSSKYCIYRVPEKIRKLNEEAYNPRIISFGPFHHGDKRFKSMEAFKIRYFRKLVRRNNTMVGLEKYIEFLKDQEESVRQCYSEIIEMGSVDFLKMLLLDSCFILEWMLCWHYEDYRDEDHSIVAAPRLKQDIHYDLTLLENQIPFFVLEGLYNLSMSCLTEIPLLNLVIPIFKYLNTQKKTPDDINSIMHFTDLILIFHRPMSTWIQDPKPFVSAPIATKLDEAGVNIVMSSSKCLVDIKFTSNGVLEIPNHGLYRSMESIFRNLIALEMCHYPQDSYMIDFFYFMVNLVNTAKDVDLLVQSGIIKNSFATDSKLVAALYNNLCINVTIRDWNYKFSSLSEELNEYCKIPSHKLRAKLKRKYFGTVVSGASTCAAIILLLLTLVQTFLSLRSAIKGN